MAILAVPVTATITATIPTFNLTTELGVAFVAAASYWWGTRAARLTLATASHWRVHFLPRAAARLAALSPTWTTPPASNDADHRSQTASLGGGTPDI